MATAWRSAEAEAHEAKADAIEHAEDALRDCIGAVDGMERLAIDAALQVLEFARERHAKRAFLLRGEAQRV